MRNHHARAAPRLLNTRGLVNGSSTRAYAKKTKQATLYVVPTSNMITAARHGRRAIRMAAQNAPHVIAAAMSSAVVPSVVTGKFDRIVSTNNA
jgi:hypothetical protein